MNEPAGADPSEEGLVYFDDVRGEFVITGQEESRIIRQEDDDDEWWSLCDVVLDPEADDPELPSS